MARTTTKDAVGISVTLSRANVERIKRVSKELGKNRSAVVDDILSLQFSKGFLGLLKGMAREQAIELKVITEIITKIEKKDIENLAELAE